MRQKGICILQDIHNRNLSLNDLKPKKQKQKHKVNVKIPLTETVDTKQMDKYIVVIKLRKLCTYKRNALLLFKQSGLANRCVDALIIKLFIKI